jgi:hypothetical protein
MSPDVLYFHCPIYGWLAGCCYQHFRIPNPSKRPKQQSLFGLEAACALLSVNPRRGDADGFHRDYTHSPCTSEYLRREGTASLPTGVCRVVSCRGLDCRSSILLWLGSGAIGTPPLGTVARQKISSLSVLYFLFGGLERAEDTVAHLAHLFSSAS